MSEPILVIYESAEKWRMGCDLSLGRPQVGLVPIPNAPGYFAGDDGRAYTTFSRGVGPKFPGRVEPRALRSSCDGYGYPFVGIRINGRLGAPRVHRLVCLAFHGPSPGRSYQTSHLKRDPADARPDNLAWETTKANHARRYEHGTMLCGEDNPTAKLTVAQAREIRQLYRGRGRGPSQAALARKFGVCQTTVSKIVRGKHWRIAA